MTTIDRLPWFRFYPPDWRGDVNLRACTLAARGLWIECLGIMHEATPRGWLVVAGAPLSIDALALHVGRPAKEVRAALGELARAGVSSTLGTDGALYSRRMVRDTDRAEAATANGAQGGRPRKANVKLKPKLNESENIHPTGAPFEPLSTEDLDLGFDLGVSEGADPPPVDLAPRSAPPLAAPIDDGPALFARFWAAYPRHSGKKAAAVAFGKLGADPAFVDTLIAAIEAQRGGRQWREGFIPHAATWLHGERWTDETEAPSTRPSRHQVAPQVGSWRERCPHTPTCETPTLCAMRGPA